MTGRSKAKRDARAAAFQAQQAQDLLRQQTAESKAQLDRERRRAQRLLARSLRASAGGFFETDQGNTLGGSGVLG